MYYLLPKRVQKTVEIDAVRKFRDILQFSKRIKAKEIKHKDEIDNWMESNLFTLQDKIGLNWMTHTI